MEAEVRDSFNMTEAEWDMVPDAIYFRLQIAEEEHRWLKQSAKADKRTMVMVAIGQAFVVVMQVVFLGMTGDMAWGLAVGSLALAVVFGALTVVVRPR